MAKNKQTYTLEIDADLRNLQGKLNSVKTLLANVLNSANAPKGLDKSLEKVGELIEKIRIKASQPIDNKTGFNSISKDIGNVQIALTSLLETVRTVQSLSDTEKLNFLPKDAQDQIGKIISGLTNYASAIDAATTGTAELATAREKLALAEQKVSAAKTRVDMKQSSLDEAKAEKQAAEQAIAAIEERKKELKELKEEQKKIEEFYKGTDEQGNKRSRAKKYEGASMRPQDIAKKIAKLETANVGDDKSLEELQEKLKVAKADVNSYTKQLATANRVYKEASQEQQELSKTVEDLNKDFEASRPDVLQKAYNQLKETAKELGISLEGIGEAYSEQDSEELIKRLSDLKKKGFDNLTKSAEQAEENLEDFGEGCRKIKNDVQEGTEALEELNDAAAKKEAFADKIKQFVGLAGAAQVLRSALRNAMQTIKELDATMTEMAVVTDLTVGDYWDQLPEYSQRASELGVSLNSAYKAATLYYQQGLKSNEVSAISAETLKMAKIAGLDAADATDKMTAALRGFNMELNETSAQRVSNVYSELAAITAADTKEIANAMTKTASIAASAGMEFETTAAFLSQIIETTRESAETAGTAMKTVIARFQELKKDPSEIGEVDGEIVDANKIETALRSVGVTLRDTNGQFRDLDDVFLELSSKWDSLDKNTQRYIATIAAGSRQQSRFIAMMSDYARTQKLVTSANNSAGASQRQFEKTLEGIEAKLAKLKNAWDEFTMGIMNSELVKAGVDILTKLLEIINKATSGFNGLAGSITKILSIVAVFKLGKIIFNKLREPMVKFFADIVREAGVAGEKAGNAAKNGLERSKQQQIDKKNAKLPEGYTYDKNGRMHKDEKFVKEVEQRHIEQQLEAEEAKTPAVKKAVGWAWDKTGGAQIKNSLTDMGVIRKARKANLAQIAEKQKEIDDIQFGLDLGLDGDEAEKAKKDIEGLEKEIVGLEKEQANLADQGDQAWESLSQGMQKAGAAITGVGVAMSVLGGVMSSLGLEEFGDVLSKVGNVITMVGAGVSALGTAIPAVAAIASAAGISTQAAWGWIGLVLAGIAVLVSTAVLIFKQIEENDPDKKLEKAQKAADEAAEGAKRAAEAYSELNDSLTSLDDKYKGLEGMTKGTEEWNKAVQDVNSSVLELLEEYSELSGLVKNEGGVLTLDVDSAEVQDIMRAYKEDELVARGSSIGAKADLAKAKTEYSLDKMDDDVFEKFQTDGQFKAVLTAIGNTAVSTAAGIAAGAAVGAGTGAFIGAKAGAVTGTVAGAAAGGVGAAPGAAVGAGAGALAGAGTGAIIGGVAGGATGLFAGIASMQYTIDQVEKHNEQNRKNVKELAQAYANGETGETVQEIAHYIERNGLAVGAAAEQMAQSLLEESETMREFGESLNSLNEQEQAIYSAMALNAQQLLDLSSFTQTQMDQINTVFDDKLMKSFEESEKERLKTEAEDKDGNFEKEKEDFAKAVYGNDARVKGNKIVDEKGETIREFENEEAWINEIAAANATKEAAEAMKEIPEIIKKTLENFTDEAQKGVFEKALEGKSLTKGELREFEEGLGDVEYKDEDGNVARTYDQLDPADRDIWGSEEAYLKSLDKDYSGIEGMWKDLDSEQKKAFGWNGDPADTESLEKAYEAYEATFTKISEKQSKALEKAEKAAGNMGITLSDKFSAEAAQGWALGLENAAPGATGNEIDDVNTALSEVLQGLSLEDVEKVMAEINSMDKMDVESWNRLGEVFEELDIDAPAEALKDLAANGIKAFNAIEKIDFNTLSEDINNIYKTIGKAQQGNRVYSEADYKEFIAANKNLEKSFTKIGDDFIYVGGSMEELTQALEKNTIAKLGEANRQLKARGAMAEIITQQTDDKKYTAVENMDQLGLMTYITNMRQAFVNESLDIADLGIEGLSNSTDISKISEDKLREWAQAIAQEGGKSSLYKEEYKKNVQEANVQRYLQNDATYNAEQAADGDEYAAQHQEALIIQAVQSGGVSNDLIEKYKEAIETKDKEGIKKWGEQIANATEKIIKASEGRDSYKDLVDRVAVALQEASQKEIDKLSELNDSINSANQRMIDKIQEQINYQREQDAIDEAQKNLDNMYAQQAYLARDTSGGSFLEAQALEADIASAEKEMENTLIDQALQRLADENERLVQQGEQQISLLQDQLNYSVESGEIAQEAGRIVSESIDKLKTGTMLDETDMYRVLFGAEGKNLSGLAAEDWSSHLSTIVTSAQNYNDSIKKDPDKEKVTGDASDQQEEESSGGSEVVNHTKQTVDNALAMAKKALQSSTGGGYLVQSEDENSDLRKAFNLYKEAVGEDKAGSLEDFAKTSIGDGDIHANDFKIFGHTTNKGNNWNWNDAKKGKKEKGSIYGYKSEENFRATVKGVDTNAEKVAKAQGVGDNEAFIYANKGYIYHGGKAYKITATDKGTDWKQFKTGGLADFTGPAWLDGTKSKPEIILNQTDSANFILLKDILADVLKSTSSTSVSKIAQDKGGDNYYDIEINVDNISEDYDVEQLADKIKAMIYEDSIYRNVNAVNLIR